MGLQAGQCAERAVEKVRDEMIRGLQITIRGEALTQRIMERIRLHEATVGALDGRIRRRDGDQPFDVRPEDGFKTLGELKDERQRWQDRVSQLMLLRDSLVGHELYALSRADLRLADLISPDVTDAATISDERWGDDAKNVAVEGLKLTISGEEIRTLIDQRMHVHRERVEWWKREQARTPEQQTEDEPLLPDQICENEAERHIWRADVLGFIRDHIDAAS